MLSQKANAGDPLAQHELGVRYLVGRGVRADTLRGAYWTRKAAEQKMGTAQFNLGILQSNGWGVEWNPFEAFDNFLSAAERGMPEAQYVLAQFFTDNLVVSRNWTEAYRWTKAAADSGYAPAKEALVEFERRGKVPAIDSLPVPASEFLTDSSSTRSRTQFGWAPVYLDFGADSTEPISDKMLLQDVLREGTPALQQELAGSPIDTSLVFGEEALSSLRRVADAGSPEALAIIGRCFEKGLQVPRDKVVAIAYYVRAVRFDSPRAHQLLWEVLREDGIGSEIRTRAMRGDNDARFVWATLMALGFHHPLIRAQAFLTEKQAVEMLRTAASENHVPSMIEIGLCYYSGRWVDEDRGKARDYWHRAVAAGCVEAEVRLESADVREQRRGPVDAVQILEHGAAVGSVLAEVALGLCYESGFGVQRNNSKAARYYRKAAQRGSQDGFRALVRLHDIIRPPDSRFVIVDDAGK